MTAIFAWTIKNQKHDQIEAGHITKPGKKDIPVTYNIYYNFCFGSYQLELISWSPSFFSSNLCWSTFFQWMSKSCLSLSNRLNIVTMPKIKENILISQILYRA